MSIIYSFPTFYCVNRAKSFCLCDETNRPVLMGRNGAFQIAVDLIKFLTKEIFFIPRPTTSLAPVFITLL